MPFLFVVLGPTGSGKGSLPDKIIAELKSKNVLDKESDRRDTFVDILIDNLVERTESYNDFVADFFKKMSKENAVAKTLNPDNMTIKLFNEAYFKARKEGKCLGNKVDEYINNIERQGLGFSNDDRKMTCEALNDKIFSDAIMGRKNIIFETTGAYFPEWLFTNFGRNNELGNIIINDYTIIFAWSVVRFQELLRRNISRAEKATETYLSNPEEALPPRIPDIRPENFKNQVKKIASVFTDFVKNIKKYTKSNRNNNNNKQKSTLIKNPVYVMVFDNNSKDTQTIFDKTASEIYNNEEVEQLLLQEYGVLGSNNNNNTRNSRNIRGGKRTKKRTKKRIKKHTKKHTKKRSKRRTKKRYN